MDEEKNRMKISAKQGIQDYSKEEDERMVR
jgi:hypothetical protein